VKEIDPNYPVSRFARQVGRSPETVREAIKFCLLPSGIREYVEKGQIPYGMACEVGRLQQAGLKEKELEWWVLRALTGNYKVPEFRKLVTDFLHNCNSGQISLLDIFTEEQRKELEKPHFRMVVERHTIMAIWSWIYYFERVLDLFERDKLGKRDSPFSVRSPVRVFRTLIDREKQLLPHWQGLLPTKTYQEAEDTIRRAEEVLSQLEAATLQD
jgi:hypothetical protein